MCMWSSLGRSRGACGECTHFILKSSAASFALSMSRTVLALSLEAIRICVCGGGKQFRKFIAKLMFHSVQCGIFISIDLYRIMIQIGILNLSVFCSLKECLIYILLFLVCALFWKGPLGLDATADSLPEPQHNTSPKQNPPSNHRA